MWARRCFFLGFCGLVLTAVAGCNPEPDEQTPGPEPAQSPEGEVTTPTPTPSPSPHPGPVTPTPPAQMSTATPEPAATATPEPVATATPVTDQDGDGASAEQDCDDTDPTIHPGAEEVCDGVDNDCDGAADEELEQVTSYPDQDADGYGNPDGAVASCSVPAGHVEAGGDCDDTDPTIHPGAEEACDGVDNDCDGAVDEDVAQIYYADQDGDGHGDPATAVAACTAPEGYVSIGDDCDDQDPDLNPETTWYLDYDDDGWGGDRLVWVQCEQPEAFVLAAGDCDDTDPAIHPGVDEVCDGQDNDCDGQVDEAGALDEVSWYLDADSDGYGDSNTTVSACSLPEGYADNAADCDDTNPAVHPGAEEVCDGVDNDCDGNADSGTAGAAALCAAEDCSAILQERPDAPDGVYWIDPGSTGAPFAVWCDMTTDGGGWTVLEKSPYDATIGRALYRDVPVNEEQPDLERHRLSRARMERLVSISTDLRFDCRGDDYLLTYPDQLFNGDGGPDSCDNWTIVPYIDAQLKGYRVQGRTMVTWHTGRSEGCAGAWHIDEHAQTSYAGEPNYPWAGFPITSSSADTFATDPNNVDTTGHECHTDGAVRYTMVRRTEICGDGQDNDGDGWIDEGTLGMTETSPAASCLEILQSCPSGRAVDGAYWIQLPDWDSPRPIWCDMTTEGGGWTLVIKADNVTNVWPLHDGNHVADLNDLEVVYARMSDADMDRLQTSEFYFHAFGQPDFPAFLVKNVWASEAVSIQGPRVVETAAIDPTAPIMFQNLDNRQQTTIAAGMATSNENYEAYGYSWVASYALCVIPERDTTRPHSCFYRTCCEPWGEGIWFNSRNSEMPGDDYPGAVYVR